MEVHEVNFNSNLIKGYHVTNATKFEIKERSIVVNLSNSVSIIAEPPHKPIPPRKSALLTNTTIQHAEALLIIVVIDETNLGGLILNGNWQAAEDIFGEALNGVPLWRSPQVEVGNIEINPTAITNQAEIINRKIGFKILVNLWYATEKTNCVIHNQHNFIEFHTQIFGKGRMQKFKENNIKTLYEDILLAEGNTHELFCEATSNNEFIYPWHQYYSDTDCIWLAVEYHPLD